MVSLYLGSISEYSGKTMLCIGMGKKFQEDGFSVGYFKPLGRLPVTMNKILTDEDAIAIQEVLGLQDRLNLICPVVLTQDLIIQGYMGKGKNLQRKIIDAYKKVSAGRDIVLVGGGSNLDEGSFLGIPGRELIKRFKAKAILIVRYGTDILVDLVLSASRAVGRNLVGVVFNSVPQESIEYLKRRIIPFLKRQDIEVLGIIPQDPILGSVSIAELSSCLGGEILCAEAKTDELVEHFMIGAMNVEGALKYFRRVQNKAVITGGDRPDIQLAALETPTKCIVLTGNLLPNDIIISRAEERGIPMIVVKEDTLTTVQRIESLLRRLRVSGRKKVERARELVKQEIDFKLLYRRLGMSAR